MYYLNKIVGAFLNPLGIGLLLLLAAVISSKVRKFESSNARRIAGLMVGLAIVWLWIWSTGAMGRWIGLSLEREFPPQLAEQMPTADAIVVLGGGVGIETNACFYADLFPAADRAWHGARLYKVGKAQKVFVTCEADALFMEDLGVPREAITVNDKARNTEEEARFITGAMKQLECRVGVGERNSSACAAMPLNGAQGLSALPSGQQNTNDGRLCQPRPPTSTCTRPRVLLVTSAWHMRRAKLMYEKYAKGVEVIPAATDYMNMTMFGRPLEFKDFVPDPSMIGQNAYMFKEWLAYYGYYFLRK